MADGIIKPFKSALDLSIQFPHCKSHKEDYEVEFDTKFKLGQKVKITSEGYACKRKPHPSYRSDEVLEKCCKEWKEGGLIDSISEWKDGLHFGVVVKKPDGLQHCWFREGDLWQI